MPRAVLGFEEVDPELRDFSPLPKGVYQAVIDCSEANKRGIQRAQSESKTPYVTLIFKCLGPDRTHAVWDRVMLSGKGLFRAGQILNAVGQHVAKGDTGVVFDTDALHGKQIRVRLDVEQYVAEDGEGKPQVREKNVIKAFFPLETAAVSDSDTSPKTEAHKGFVRSKRHVG